MNFDENKSTYLDENIERHAPSMSQEEREQIKKDAEFRVSLNGFRRLFLTLSSHSFKFSMNLFS